MELTKEQMQRLYMVFDFEEHEEIVSASIESANGGNMEIHYIDTRDNSTGCYKPYLAKHSKEDLEKLDLILNGVKVERNPI